MITIKLQGGLGNQMFQYALGLSIARKRNVPLKMDLSFYESGTERKFRLNRFNITAFALRGHDPRINDPLLKMIDRILPVSMRTIVRERQFAFDEKILAARDGAYLIGYWNSPRYFAGIEAAVRQEFRLREPLGKPAAAAAEKIAAAGNPVALHVRRGDYAANPKINRVHGVLPLSYYNAAAERIGSEIERPVFFVFSDDIGYARQNVKLPHETIFVSEPGAIEDYEELSLMAACSHHVIANSTLSWWGAWLNPNQMKIVIAPQHWSNDPRRETKDLLPSAWIRL